MRAESKPIPSWEFEDREATNRPHVDDDARILIDDEAYRIYLDARKRYLAALDMPVRDGIREIYTLCDDLEIDDETASFFIECASDWDRSEFSRNSIERILAQTAYDVSWRRYGPSNDLDDFIPPPDDHDYSFGWRR